MKKLQKIQSFLQKLTNDFTILEFENLREEIKNAFPEFDEGNIRDALSEEELEAAERLVKRAFYKSVDVYGNYINRWDKGLFKPNEKELEELKRYQKNFDTKILPTYSELKKETPSIASRIEEEEKISKERKKTLDRLLLENDKPDNQKEQMAKLQTQISSLEEKLSQNPSSDDSEQTKQELARLKSELAVLKAKKNQQNDKNPKPNDFLWMAIGGGITIVILLLIIVFLYKKSKK